VGHPGSAPPTRACARHVRCGRCSAVRAVGPGTSQRCGAVAQPTAPESHTEHLLPADRNCAKLFGPRSKGPPIRTYGSVKTWAYNLGVQTVPLAGGCRTIAFALCSSFVHSTRIRYSGLIYEYPPMPKTAHLHPQPPLPLRDELVHVPALHRPRHLHGAGATPLSARNSKRHSGDYLLLHGLKPEFLSDIRSVPQRGLVVRPCRHHPTHVQRQSLIGAQTTDWYAHLRRQASANVSASPSTPSFLTAPPVTPTLF
jgi:hypothetical protein